APGTDLFGQWGTSFEDGKTGLTFSAAWSDNTHSMRFGDRREFYDRGIATALRNSGRAYLGNLLGPPLGGTPNLQILSFDQTLPSLTFDDGTSLGSPFTFIPPGTSPSTSAAQLRAGLIANAGSYNLQPPSTAQSPTGLGLPLGSNNETKSFTLSARRAFASFLEVFLDGSYSSNQAGGRVAPDIQLGIEGDFPTNPFEETVFLNIPFPAALPFSGNAETRRAGIGLQAALPWQWGGMLDYSWSESRFERSYQTFDEVALFAAASTGAFNPFVDTVAYPDAVDLYRYLVPPSEFSGSSRLEDLTLRLSGPVPVLPWGAPLLSVNLERRRGTTPENTSSQSASVGNFVTTYFKRSQITDSAYVETLIPLVAADRFPLLRSLELQLAVRTERYTVDTGTSSRTEDLLTGEITYGRPNRAGQPVFSEDTYNSTNSTLGFKYEPLDGLLLRASYSTGFLPPTPEQLLPQPDLDRGRTFISDLRAPGGPASYRVSQRGGGNPDLKPETSKSWNAGLVWLPRIAVLDGLRVNVEWYQIDGLDRISSFSTQYLVDNEADYPGRVTRDASGRITLIDYSLTNLFNSSTRGWDLNLGDSWDTRFGSFSGFVAATAIVHQGRQNSPNGRGFEYAGYVGEGGPAKYKGNLGLLWERNEWSLGWGTRYFGSYKQTGATAGPVSVRANGGTAPVVGSTLTAQGSETIPAQVYHDFFARYSLGENASPLLSGLTVQLNVKNVFDKVPEYDANYAPYLVSPYGDWRLRAYSLSVKKSF
ncbi:MAG: TonB-dependent receptor domain-containing protein, partial [Pseudonocardiaceae bacterium]